uniref:Helitron helicase-like domain-containing protein n=1 Tax=Amphimedon queenslandica TaxID=400682 RepID=A0A1X7SE17_AMPQE
MRGAPHYHILLWIENAPVVGIDRPEEVCSFIQHRITCHIPDSNTSPDLKFLVTRYQNAQMQQILQAKY